MASDIKARISVTHGEDLDGLASQVLIKRHWEAIGGQNLEFYRESYDTLGDQLENLVSRTWMQAQFCFTDLALNPKYEGVLIQLIAGNGGNSVIVYDHHAGTRQIQEDLNEHPPVRAVTGPDETCTTWLVQQELFPRNPQAMFLAEEARHSDLQDEGQRDENRQLSRLISATAAQDVHDDTLGMIAGILAQPNFYRNRWLRKQMAKAQESYNTAMASLVINREKMSSLWVGWSVCDQISTGEVAREILHKDPTDIAIGLDSRGKISIKTRNPTISARKIAEMWGGGGHEDRASFLWQGEEAFNPYPFMAMNFLPSLRDFLEKA